MQGYKHLTHKHTILCQFLEKAHLIWLTLFPFDSFLALKKKKCFPVSNLIPSAQFEYSQLSTQSYPTPVIE